MYVGNGYGVLEFDGSSWRLIQTANNSFCRSLAKDADGRIYVGASSEFGFLAPSANGDLRYVSLLHHVSDEDRVFNYVWTTLSTPDGIYFQTQERLFRFRPDRSPGMSATEDSWDVKVWQPTGRFAYAFWADHSYYVHQIGVGLMRMSGDSLQLVPGSEQFADGRMQVLLPLKDRPGMLLLGTFEQGLFLYDGHNFQPLRTEADAYLRGCTLYDGIALTDGSIGLVTLDAGFVMLDAAGRLIQHLDKTTGFPSSTLTALYEDRQRNIWLAYDGGIAIVESNSPLTRFHGVSGSGPVDLKRFNSI